MHRLLSLRPQNPSGCTAATQLTNAHSADRQRAKKDKIYSCLGLKLRATITHAPPHQHRTVTADTFTQPLDHRYGAIYFAKNSIIELDAALL
jgi:hypothetical protein